MNRQNGISLVQRRRQAPRKRIKDVDGRGQPFCQFVIAGHRLLGLLDLNMKDSQDIGWRAAGLQLGHQWMREKVVLRLLPIFLHRSVKRSLEIGRSRRSGRFLRHGTSTH